MLTTFFLTVLVVLTLRIEIGEVLSSLLFMKRMADLGKTIPQVVDTELLEDYSELPKEIGIYEISGPLFFASARQYTEVLITTGLKSKIIIIRMRHVPFVDSTGMQNLKEAVKILTKAKIKVFLSGVNDNVRADLKRSGVCDLIGECQIFNTFELAAEQAKKVLPQLKH